MDDNISHMYASLQDIHNCKGPSSLIGIENSISTIEWSSHFYNGYEIWYLVGMPMIIFFCLSLLSFSALSALSTVIQRFNWSKLHNASLVYWFSKDSSSLTSSLRTNVPDNEVKPPRHIAVIMDGNRRYGKMKYGSGTRGHSDGSRTLGNFTDWCIQAGIEILTVYAFSTENWNRSQLEIDILMNLFKEFVHDIVPQALQRGIRIRVLTSDYSRVPLFVLESIKDIEEKTKDCTNFQLNICFSYGARGEIVQACKHIAEDVVRGDMNVNDINEKLISEKLLTKDLTDPDILLRTSGELRLSNFLLYQIAYTELIFVDKNWPEMTKLDLQNVVLEYSHRKRRFGK